MCTYNIYIYIYIYIYSLDDRFYLYKKCINIYNINLTDILIHIIKYKP